MSGRLVVIPTPIGQLSDISLRAIETIKTLDLLLCEDTRVTGRLLRHYEIKVPLKPYHNFNEHKLTNKIVELIRAGNVIGLVSDAGTPGVSDPGHLLIRAIVDAQLSMEILPGANALLPGLLYSGFSSDKFFFEGFLPHKKGRKARWEFLASLPHTFILYESPHRIKKCLEEIKTYCGKNREVTVCRELTKMYEEIIRGTVVEVFDQISLRNSIKGELTVIVRGKSKKKN